jgi:hypothetical protein
MRLDYTRRTVVSTSNELSISHSAGEKSGTLLNETIGAVLAGVKPDSRTLRRS